MLLAHLVLHTKPSFLCHRDDLAGRPGQCCKALSALDPRHTDVCTKVEIGVELPLRERDLERSAAIEILSDAIR